jgi:L-aspartate oxidase
VIDENGRTSIENLYAAGETACSGVHGANRLASNSLLEGIVYADRVYKNSLQLLEQEYSGIDVKPIDNIKSSVSKSAVFVQKKTEEVRRLTWDYLGISRSNERLLKMQKKTNILKVEIEQHFKEMPFTVDGIELRNMVFIAEMIVRSAIQRKESRGLHFNADYPFLLPGAKDTVINIR